MLTDATNEDLVQEIRNRGDPDGLLRLQLMRKNQGFIYGMWRPYNAIIPKSDLEGISFIAIDTACNSYNPDSGAGFLKSLSWALQRELSFAATDLISGIHLTRALQTDLRTYSKVIRDYYTIHHEEPEDSHILATMGIDEERLSEIRQAYSVRILQSLDSPIATDDEGAEITLSDTLASDADVSEAVTAKSYRDSLAELFLYILSGLPQQEHEIIEMRYYKGMTVSDTAADTGLPEREIRRLSNAALRAMRRNTRLQHFLDESNLYHLTGVSHFRVTNESQTEHDALQLLYFRNKKEGDL